MAGIKVHTGASNGYSFGASYESGPDAQVNLADEKSLEKWSYVLGISKRELIDAAKEFGPVIKNIRKGINSDSSSKKAA